MDMQRNSFSPSFKSRPEEQVDKRQPIWPPSVCQADLLWSRNYAAEHCVWTRSAACKCHESKINRNPSIMAGPWRTTQSQSVVERCKGGSKVFFSSCSRCSTNTKWWSCKAKEETCLFAVPLLRSSPAHVSRWFQRTSHPSATIRSPDANQRPTIHLFLPKHQSALLL